MCCVGTTGSGGAVAGDALGAQSVALSAQDRVKDRELKSLHMLLCVDSQFKELVAGAATAREAWVAIEQCFKGEARARKGRLPSGQALRHATEKEHSGMERRCMSTYSRKRIRLEGQGLGLGFIRGFRLGFRLAIQRHGEGRGQEG